MAGFRATSAGVTARFARPEAAMIRELVGQVAELIGGPEADDTAGPAGAAWPGAAGWSDDASGTSEPHGQDGTDGADQDATSSDADLRVPGADELARMVGLSDAAEPPDDPILARLLPDAYQDDPDAAADFRRFTESGLRSAKVADARTVLATMPPGGGRVRLSVEQAEIWVRALNDVRLALGVRLGVTDDFDGLSEDLGPADPRYAFFQVYQWLSYVQETLITAL
jgi:uncharacterized protein DUF2017